MRFAGHLVLGLLLLSGRSRAAAAQIPLPRSAVLVELFTSEGCSSCPAADDLLRLINGRQNGDGQLIIGLSEHVSYWNRLGWTDPFSSDQYTERQNQYSSRFRTDGPYTPQMVVNGREQFVGSNRDALRAALAQESARKNIQLHITEARVQGKQLFFTCTASEVPANSNLQLMAALVDDADHSNVGRGENSGRKLEHVFVARSLAEVGRLSGDSTRSASLPLPVGFAGAQPGHHLIVFAQERNLGAVSGVDSKAF